MKDDLFKIVKSDEGRENLSMLLSEEIMRQETKNRRSPHDYVKVYSDLEACTYRIEPIEYEVYYQNKDKEEYLDGVTKARKLLMRRFMAHRARMSDKIKEIRTLNRESVLGVGK